MQLTKILEECKDILFKMECQNKEIEMWRQSYIEKKNASELQKQTFLCLPSYCIISEGIDQAFEKCNQELDEELALLKMEIQKIYKGISCLRWKDAIIEFQLETSDRYQTQEFTWFPYYQATPEVAIMIKRFMEKKNAIEKRI